MDIRRPAAFFGAATAGLVLDQGAKAAVFGLLEGPGRPETYPLIPGALHITPVRNPGVAFGIEIFPMHMILAISVAAVAFLVWLYVRSRASSPALHLWAFAMLIAGAAGNAVDRVAWGKVLDFIDIRVWPVFNLADVYICAGVGLYLLPEALLSGRGKAGAGAGPAAAPSPPPGGSQGKPPGAGR
ncbi:MAG: signal peptidase II [Planctomycetota bacterium]|nr:signal peptidase II [Planctomycetota bacterium]